MGKLAKSITVEVPASVVYDALKKVDSSRYISDLLDEHMPSSMEITKDTPNSLLVAKGTFRGLKCEMEYSLRPLGESSCEVTIKLEHVFTLGFATKEFLIKAIDNMLMLEFGYKVGSRRITGS